MTETSGAACYPVRQAPDPDAFDVLALGFWVRKGQPDARAQRYMASVRGKRVFFFGTLGAWPHSDHARRCMIAARQLLQANDNTVLDGFLCQGRVNPQVVAASQRKGSHAMTAERLHRLQEAARHPDGHDLLAARQRWQNCLQQAAAAPLASVAPLLPAPAPLGRPCHKD